MTMPSFQVSSRRSTPEIVLIKDKNYKKAKMKGGLGWMKNIGNDPARILMGTIFLVYPQSRVKREYWMPHRPIGNTLGEVM